MNARHVGTIVRYVVAIVGGAILQPTIVIAEVSSGVAAAAQSFAAADQGSMTGSFVRMLGALFFCLGLFAAGVQLYRKYVTKQGGSVRRRMVILERVALTQKASLMVVSLDGKEFLVASGSEKVTMLPTQTLSTPVFTDSLNEACEEVGAYDV